MASRSVRFPLLLLHVVTNNRSSKDPQPERREVEHQNAYPLGERPHGDADTKTALSPHSLSPKAGTGVGHPSSRRPPHGGGYIPGSGEI
jgi:hypothetical protein